LQLGRRRRLAGDRRRDSVGGAMGDGLPESQTRSRNYRRGSGHLRRN
jgi:hypothetical protein